MNTQGSYLYGVIPANGPMDFGAIGIGGGQVRAVPYGELAMIASSAERIRFSELAPEKTLNYLAEHQRVLEHAMADLPVIPLKFGTYAEDEAQIVGILESGQRELAGALENYVGKIELDVVASWADFQAVLGEIASDKAIVSMKAKIAEDGEPSMEQRLGLGQMVKKLLDELREQVAAELVVALRAKWPNIVINPTKDDSMVLNAAVLIDRSEEDQFDQTIEQLNGQYNNRLNFRCVGPLPPYSFATVDVKTVRRSELHAARQVLELCESASLNEIKLAHRRLLRKHHPDGNPDPGAAERIKQISAAYELLEEYALNFKHRFNGAAGNGLAIVKISSLAELREKLTTQAA